MSSLKQNPESDHRDKGKKTLVTPVIYSFTLSATGKNLSSIGQQLHQSNARYRLPPALFEQLQQESGGHVQSDLHKPQRSRR